MTLPQPVVMRFAVLQQITNNATSWRL